MSDLILETGFTFGEKSIDSEELNIKDEKKTKRRRSACIDRETKQIYRRAFSETQLLDLIPDGLQKGHSYNFITGGDVDGLSCLKIVLREQNLDYCLMSTWCMACEDVLQIEEWLKDSKIKKMDVYVGEIFPGTYKQEYAKLTELIPQYGGRVCVFKNHSKIFAGIGKKFSFGIQTSANVNTNPRTENGCITIDHELYGFYKEYFDGIVSFDKSSITTGITT